ncbi:hypothetical protein MNBD_PLANCTO02-3337, partial [hydrothermal vent metagenome]
FVHHEGEVKTDANGNVHLDYLPSPVLGTFWSYSADKKVKLKSVTAGKQRVQMKRTALTLINLLKANMGKDVIIQEQTNISNNPVIRYEATLLSIPTQSAEEITATSHFGSGPHTSVQGGLILLKTKEGTRVVSINKILKVIFVNKIQPQFQYEEIRTRLRLNLDWGNRKPSIKAKIGMVYLQKGIRWIPHYRLTLNEDGTVKVQLQATLINELTDLNKAKVHLLTGVPQIHFQSMTDPIAMQQQATQLSGLFRQRGTGNLLNNAIMTQRTITRQRNLPPSAQPIHSPNDNKNQEMFTFTIHDITLAKGERMVVPVGEWTMKYEYIYKLHLTTMPSSRGEAGSLSKVIQTVRITNTSNVPLTTAPALIKSKKGILGQGMMTYAAPRGSVDLTITTAVNVPARHRENEIRRLERSFIYNEYYYTRISLKGEITLTNFNKKSIRLKVVRTTMGKADSVGEEGTIIQPAVWTSWSSPKVINIQSHIHWEKKLKSGESIKLPYEWHYFIVGSRVEKNKR